MRTKKNKKVSEIQNVTDAQDQVQEVVSAEMTTEQKAVRLTELTKQYRAATEARNEANRLATQAVKDASAALESIKNEFGGPDGKVTLNIEGKLCSISSRAGLYFVKSPKGQNNTIIV